MLSRSVQNWPRRPPSFRIGGHESRDEPLTIFSSLTLSFISGTYYVQVPRGAAALKFEDPRLSKMMAAPPGKAFVSVPAKAGDVILFESWLRHEVPPARYAGERISISFNYTWSAR